MKFLQEGRRPGSDSSPFGSSGANTVVNLSAFARTATGPANFSPGLDDALAVRPLSQEHKERGEEHRSE